MDLKKIYRPIENEIKEVERFLERSLKGTKNDFILGLNDVLLGSPGKRLRSALTILSAHASMAHRASTDQDLSVVMKAQLTRVASAIELIHMASLVHDDIIDHSLIRRNRPTVNSIWGGDVAISLGDYLYSVAFDLVSGCGNIDILQCISSAARAMCEGELSQVSERDNPDLLKDQYIMIVKKKTASLFAASCQAGAIISRQHEPIQKAFMEYGLNWGVCFQIVDDYLDITGKEADLGKRPGQDLRAGEITLPLIYILESTPQNEFEEIKNKFFSGDKRAGLDEIRERLHRTGAQYKTRQTTLFYMNAAKENISLLKPSPYKESLLSLSDFITERAFDVNG